MTLRLVETKQPAEKNMKTFRIMTEFYCHELVSVDANNFEEAKAIIKNDYDNTIVSGRNNEGRLVEVTLFTNSSMMTEV